MAYAVCYMETNHNENVEKGWDDFWKKREPDKIDRIVETQGFFNKLKKPFLRLEHDYNLDKWIKETILKELPEKENLKIIEAGCGEGESAYNIYNDKHTYFLFDRSTTALEITRSRYKKNNYNGYFVKGSIFNFPFKSNTFDVVLSIGVFEHFRASRHKQLYEEHARITKKHGTLIILVPSKKAYFYRLGKWYAQRNNLWDFGYEEPFRSIKPLYKDNNNVRHIKEYSGGFLIQFYFMMYLFRRIKSVKMLYLAFVSVLNRLFWFINSARQFGFYIVNVTEKV